MVKFLVLFLFGFYSASFGSIIHVPEDFATIPEAIEEAVDGDTVMVGPGDFREPISFNGKGILLTSQYGPDSTTINRVRIQNNEDSTTILRGFSIIPDGGEIALWIAGADNPKIEGNVISGMSYLGHGPAVFASGGAIMKSNIVTENISNNSSYAAGVWLFDSCLFSQNIVSNNITYSDLWICRGGGLYIQGALGVICSYNLIMNNRAECWEDEWSTAYGGGVFIGGGKLVNNTIVNNEAMLWGELSSNGGGVATSTESTLKNNIIANNPRGGGVYVWDYSIDLKEIPAARNLLPLADVINPSYSAITGFNYNDIWGNYPYDYNENYIPGDGDIFEDPLFVNPEEGDYHLQEGSPCIDAGDPNLPLDPDSTRADIGCYYYHHSTDILETDEPSGPHKFYLKQNYPNPFNGQTIISYYLPEPAQVELNIINMRGELVAQPVNSRQPAGDHQLIWQGTHSDGSPVSTGIYFYELKIGSRRDIKAMILLK